METAWVGFELTLSWNQVLGLSNIGKVGQGPTRVEHLKGAELRDAPANVGLVNEVTGFGKFFVKLSAFFCSNYTLLLALVTLGDTNINLIWFFFVLVLPL